MMNHHLPTKGNVVSQPSIASISNTYQQHIQPYGHTGAPKPKKEKSGPTLKLGFKFSGQVLLISHRLQGQMEA